MFEGMFYTPYGDGNNCESYYYVAVDCGNLIMYDEYCISWRHGVISMRPALSDNFKQIHVLW